jgi:uncharacterized metal-binding protein
MADCCSTPKEATADSCCTGDNVLIFACSGGSNVGQITNEAAKKLDQEGVGKFYCLIGVGAMIEGMVANAKGADRVVALDGCSVACAKIACEKAGVPITDYVVVTELGVEKGHHFGVSCGQVDAVCSEVRAELA